MNKLCIILTVLIASISSFSNAQNIEAIEKGIAEIIEKHTIPGVAYSFVKGEFTYSGGVGKVSVEGNSKVNAQTRMRVGSITKSFLAIGLLQLQEKGKLSLDDLVEDLIPEIKIDNPWKESSPITLRHLLEHTSGLSDISFSEIYAESNEISAKEAIESTPSALSVQFEPGSYFQYSNPGYLLAGYILEKYAEQSFEMYLTQNILDPLEMNNSTFIPFYESGEQPVHHIYKGRKIVVNTYKPIMNKWAGNLATTSEDMSKFVQFLASENVEAGILTKSSLLEIRRPKTAFAAREGIKTGYALGVMKNSFGNQVVFGNRGGAADLHARFNYVPELGIGYFFSMNTSNGACGRELNSFLSKSLFPKNISKQRSNIKLNNERLGEIEGFYQSNTSRMKVLSGIDKLIGGLNVYSKHDTLFVKYAGRKPTPLFTEDGVQFYSNESVLNHILINKKEGKPFFLETNDGGGFYYKTSKTAYTMRIITIVASFIFSLVVGLIFLVRMIRAILKNNYKQGIKNSLYVTLPVLMIVLLALVSSVDLAEIEKLGTLNIRTLTIYLISILYPVLTVLSIWSVFKTLRKELHLFGKISMGIGSFSAVCLSVFLVSNGYFGIVLW